MPRRTPRSKKRTYGNSRRAKVSKILSRRGRRTKRSPRRPTSNYRKKRSKKNQRGGMDADTDRNEEPLTDFESECMRYYLGITSDPFNFKLRGIDEDITRDDWWKAPIPLKYFGRDINTMSESQLVELGIRRQASYQSWFEMMKTKPFVKKIDNKWCSVRGLGMELIRMNTTIDGMIEGISRAIKKRTVKHDLVVYRGLNIKSIKSFNKSDPAFKSFTTDINVILNSEGEYLNRNGCCVLRTKLNKGVHAFYDSSEKQYVLDKDVRFSEPKHVQHSYRGNFTMYHVDIISDDSDETTDDSE